MVELAQMITKCKSSWKNDNDETNDTTQQRQLHLARFQPGINAPKKSRIMNTFFFPQEENTI